MRNVYPQNGQSVTTKDGNRKSRGYFRGSILLSNKDKKNLDYKLQSESIINRFSSFFFLFFFFLLRVLNEIRQERVFLDGVCACF